MGSSTNDYQAYMLRIWKERSQEADVPGNFRMSLEDTQTGTRVGFADLEALINFLQKQMKPGNPETPGEGADDASAMGPA